MKLFGEFEAVKFPEENLIFITDDGYLYYIYNPKYENWKWQRYSNAGNSHITVKNYADVSKAELSAAMQGIFPTKETDFMRLCWPGDLCIRDMLALLKEDYPLYMSSCEIYHTVHRFLLESDICHKSFLKLRELLNHALALQQDNGHVLAQIKEICLSFIGRDVFKKEIRIIDGHNGSSYFWIMPVRVIDYSNTNNSDNVAEMRSAEISIEEDDVYQYLMPFIDRHYDDEFKANKRRVEWQWTDDNGNEEISVVSGFEWYLTHNFFTLDSIENMLKDIRAVIDAVSSGKESKLLSKMDKADLALIVDFYRRFVFRMEYMLQVGKENGYNLISFMGP